MPRVISLFLPTLSTDRVRRKTAAPPPETPLVLVGRDGRRRGVLAADAALDENMGRRIARPLIGGDLWISEYILTYDRRPCYVVSIMEFEDGKVVRETQYFGDPFEPGPSRAEWVERID